MGNIVTVDITDKKYNHLHVMSPMAIEIRKYINKNELGSVKKHGDYDWLYHFNNEEHLNFFRLTFKYADQLIIVKR